MDKLLTLGAIALVVYFLLEFYKDYAKASAAKRKSQMDFDEMTNLQYIQQTQPEQYKDWEKMVNKVFDPGNLFGMR